MTSDTGIPGGTEWEMETTITEHEDEWNETTFNKTHQYTLSRSLPRKTLTEDNSAVLHDIWVPTFVIGCYAGGHEEMTVSTGGYVVNAGAGGQARKGGNLPGLEDKWRLTKDGIPSQKGSVPDGATTAAAGSIVFESSGNQRYKHRYRITRLPDEIVQC